MSHVIPVFFFPIECEQVPTAIESWDVAYPLISDHVSDEKVHGTWISSSRNWWHQDALVKVARHLHIDGLEFALAEIAILDREQLEQAKEALGVLFQSLQSGFPDFGDAEKGDGTLWWLTRAWKGGEIVQLSTDEVRNAMAKAHPARYLSDTGAADHEALIRFFSFVKSLQAAVDETLWTRRCMAYLRPQP